MADTILKRSMPEAAYKGLAHKVQGFKMAMGRFYGLRMTRH